MNNSIRVFAPATIGNIGIGFDVLGLCLEHPGDLITIRSSERPGVRIQKISGTTIPIPTDPQHNTASVAVIRLLEHLELNAVGFDIEIEKQMPFGSGLGSSAASAVAAVVAANELLGSPLSRRALLPFACDGEAVSTGGRVVDNVAPSLLGGIVLIRDIPSLDVMQLPVPKALYAALVYPHIQILTADSRSKLQETVSLKDYIRQSANLASFIHALHTSDFELIRRCLHDIIVEPQRAPGIPHFYEVKKAAMEAGALACSISGSGPTIFALCGDAEIAERTAAEMAQVFQKNGIQNTPYCSEVNTLGATVR
jgi:homoserine kinase